MLNHEEMSDQINLIAVVNDNDGYTNFFEMANKINDNGNGSNGSNSNSFA